MYPRYTPYYSVPTSDPESSQIPALRLYRYPYTLESLKRRLVSAGRNDLVRLGLLIAIILGIILITVYRILWGGDIIFHPSDRPGYLDLGVERPLVIRLAIMVRVDGFQRRQSIRESVLYGVPGSDVQLDYKFFVGRAKDGKQDSHRTMLKLEHENFIYNDIVILEDVEDISERLSEKRFHALKWAGSVPQDQYDYAMTMDSDTFCRFQALARRLRYQYPSLKPRDEPILIGRMSRQSVYYQNTISDTSSDPSSEDHWFIGPVYPYPVGIGYMLSSNLTATLLSADPPIPHHIYYPYDDVMIGSWVAALKYFPDPEIVFEDPEPTYSDSSPMNPNKRKQVHLKPYIPHRVDTEIVDDPVGWHDYRHRGGVKVAHAIGWETVCVHRMSPSEMSAFRSRVEIRREWEY